MKKIYILLFVSLILNSCNSDNKKNLEKAEKVIVSYYKTYDTYKDTSAFDTLLSYNFKIKYKNDFVKRISTIKENFGAIIKYENSRKTAQYEGLTLTKILLEYKVEYETMNTSELFELTEDSPNNLKINAYSIDYLKK